MGIPLLHNFDPKVGYSVAEPAKLASSFLNIIERGIYIFFWNLVIFLRSLPLTDFVRRNWKFMHARNFINPENVNIIKQARDLGPRLYTQ